MIPTANEFHCSLWLEEWRRFMSVEDEPKLSQETLARLLDPLKGSDPVFATSVSREMVNKTYLDIAISILCSHAHSKRRIFMCQVIFYISKTTTRECRLLIVHLIPAILWTEWLLSSQLLAYRRHNTTGELDPHVDALSEDVTALEVAVLSAFRQDYNINPLAPTYKIVPLLSHPSIYYSGEHQDTKHDAEMFPATVKASDVTICPSLYPSYPIDKFDSKYRKIITNRLCRYFHEHIPDVSDHILAFYGLMLSRIALIGTRLDVPSVREELRQELLTGDLFRPSSSHSRILTKGSIQSDLHLTVSKLTLNPVKFAAMEGPIDHHMLTLMTNTFFPQQDTFKTTITRSYPVTDEIVILWSEALAPMQCRLPLVEELLRGSLMKRARVMLLPGSILALSQ